MFNYVKLCMVIFDLSLAIRFCQNRYNLATAVRRYRQLHYRNNLIHVYATLL